MQLCLLFMCPSFFRLETFEVSFSSLFSGFSILEKLPVSGKWCPLELCGAQSVWSFAEAPSNRGLPGTSTSITQDAPLPCVRELICADYKNIMTFWQSSSLSSDMTFSDYRLEIDSGKLNFFYCPLLHILFKKSFTHSPSYPPPKWLVLHFWWNRGRIFPL